MISGDMAWDATEAALADGLDIGLPPLVDTVALRKGLVANYWDCYLPSSNPRKSCPQVLGIKDKVELIEWPLRLSRLNWDTIAAESDRVKHIREAWDKTKVVSCELSEVEGEVNLVKFVWKLWIAVHEVFVQQEAPRICRPGEHLVLTRTLFYKLLKEELGKTTTSAEQAVFLTCPKMCCLGPLFALNLVAANCSCGLPVRIFGLQRNALQTSSVLKKYGCKMRYNLFRLPDTFDFEAREHTNICLYIVPAEPPVLAQSREDHDPASSLSMDDEGSVSKVVVKSKVVSIGELFGEGTTRRKELENEKGTKRRKLEGGKSAWNISELSDDL